MASISQKIDVKRLVARFGGPKKLQESLTKKGHTITIKAINQWGWRRRIPGPWMAVLMDMAESQGRPLRIQQYQLSESEGMDFLQ